MRAWMVSAKELTRRAAEIRKLEGQARKIAEEIEESRKTLLNRLVALGEMASPEKSSLEEILLKAEEVIRSAKDLRVRRESLKKEIDEAIKGNAKAEEEERKEYEAFAQWEKDWAAAVGGSERRSPGVRRHCFSRQMLCLVKKAGGCRER